MTDTCVIENQTGSTFDDTTGEETPSWTTVYSGACKVQQSALSLRQPDVGPAEAHVGSMQIHLPHDTTGVEVGHRVTVTSENPPLDGRQFRVVGLPAKTHQTALRIDVEERQ